MFLFITDMLIFYLSMTKNLLLSFFIIYFFMTKSHVFSVCYFIFLKSAYFPRGIFGILKNKTVLIKIGKYFVT